MLVQGNELDGFAHHGLPGQLGPRAEGDDHLGAETEAEIVGVLGHEVIEYRLRRTLKLHQHLSGSDREALAGPDIERHASPPSGVEVQAESRKGLHLRVRGYPLLLAIAMELPAHD